MIVLDASALLAFLFREPGEEIVSELFARGSTEILLSMLNLSEVLGRFARDGHDPEPIRQKLEAAGIRFVPMTSDQALCVARLLPSLSPFGLSLADRTCLALAAEHRAEVVTADRIWRDAVAQAALPVKVTLIR